MPLRRETARLGALTLPDYFELRFGDRTRLLRIVSMIVILFFYTVYVAAQLHGAGKILHATFAVPQVWGIVIGVTVVVLYTLLGGFLAVAWTDLIQGLLMMAVAVVLPVVGLAAVGGPVALVEKLAPRGADFLTLSGGKVGAAFFFGVVVGGMSWGFGYLGQPHLLTRYMAVRRTAQLRQGSLIAMGWTLVSYWGAPMIGIVGVAVLGPDLADHEQVMPLLAKALMPGWIAGLMIAGATAAMMSTADSQLLVATSALIEDIYVRRRRFAPVRHGRLRVDGPGGFVRPSAAAVAVVETHDEVGRPCRHARRHDGFGGLAELRDPRRDSRHQGCGRTDQRRRDRHGQSARPGPVPGESDPRVVADESSRSGSSDGRAPSREKLRTSAAPIAGMSRNASAEKACARPYRSLTHPPKAAPNEPVPKATKK
jgi:hypothetical protein